MSLEKRSHARVAALINARLLAGAAETELPARDISRGGIFLKTAAPIGPVGGRVNLKLAVMAGIRPIVVSAEIARVVAQGPMTGTGLRFVHEAGAAQSAQVVDLIDRAMLGPGTDKRAWPRVYWLIPVVCRTKIEMKGLVRDLCEGGAGLNVDAPIEVNESLTLELPRGAGQAPMTLEGWACTSDKLAGMDGGYRVGVRFSRLSPTMRAELLEFLKQQYRR